MQNNIEIKEGVDTTAPSNLKAHKNLKVKTILLLVFCVLLVSGGIFFKVITDKQKADTSFITQAYNIEIPLEQTNTSAENVAVQYANYILGRHYEAAYSLVEVPEGTIYTMSNMIASEVDLDALPNDYILIDATAKSDGVTLKYAKKLGEAFKNDETNTYIGESCDTPCNIFVPIVNKGPTHFKIGVRTEKLSSEQIALKVPKGTIVYAGGTLIPDALLDNDGYYTLSNYVVSDTLDLKLISDVETKEVTMDLINSYDDVLTTNSPAELRMLQSNDTHLGLKAWNYRWKTDRETNDEAIAYAKTATQAVFDSIIKQQDYYTADFQSVMSEKANTEAMKVYYMRLCDNFKSTKSKTCSDLKCVVIQAMPEETMHRKDFAFEMLDTHTMLLHVDMNYSYIVTTEGEDRPRKGSVSGEIKLTKDNGEWKLLCIDDNILKAIS